MKSAFGVVDAKGIFRSLAVSCLAAIPAFSQSALWERTAGPNAGPVSCIAIGDSGAVYAGTAAFLDSGGVYVSKDEGATWTAVVPAELNCPINSIVVESTGLVLAGGGTQTGVVFRSTNGGVSWKRIDLPGNFRVLSLVQNRHGYIFAGMGTIVLEPDGRILRSTDNGETWTPSGLERCEVWSLATDALGDIFAGIDFWYINITPGIYRSKDDGMSWTTPGGVPYAGPSLATSPLGYVFACAGAWLYRTSDNGESWDSLGLMKMWVTCVASDSKGFIFAGGNQGVLWSSDNGNSWTKVAEGLDSVFVESIAIDSSDHLYAGAQDGIVYRTKRPTVSVEDNRLRLPVSLELMQNYPNPFNPSTTIKYELPRSSVVRLCVYDLLGREVSVLVNERRDAGSYEVKFDAAGLSSGVYFYRLQAGDFTQTKRLLVLK